MERKTGVEILERYGMSETIINTSNPLDGERVAGTVGFLCRASISGFRTQKERSSSWGDRNHRGVWPGGDEGLLENAGKTKEEMRQDGYFITGDLGVQDEEGRVSIVGGVRIGYFGRV